MEWVQVFDSVCKAVVACALACLLWAFLKSQWRQEEALDEICERLERGGFRVIGEPEKPGEEKRCCR